MAFKSLTFQTFKHATIFLSALEEGYALEFSK